MSLTKGPGIDGRHTTGPEPLFGVQEPNRPGYVSTMPFPGDGQTPWPSGKPAHARGPRKTNGAPKKRGGKSKGKSIYGKVGAGLGAAAALAGTAYAAHSYNQERQAYNSAFKEGHGLKESTWSPGDTTANLDNFRKWDNKLHTDMRATQNFPDLPRPQPFHNPKPF